MSSGLENDSQTKLSVQDVSDIVDISMNLGLPEPSGFCFLPRNIFEAKKAKDLLHDDFNMTIKKVWLKEGIKVGELQQKTHYWAQRDYGVQVTLFLGCALYSQNKTFIDIALNVLANYVADKFKSMKILVRKDCKIDLIVQKKAKRGFEYKKLTYEGPADKLHELSDLVKRVMENDEK